MFSEGREINDTFGRVDGRMIALTRRDADLLFYLAALLLLPVRRGPHRGRNGGAAAGGCLCADLARYGQFGQFIDIDTGEIVTGGTAASGALPGALMLGRRMV